MEGANSTQPFQTSAWLEHCHTHLLDIGIDEWSSAHHLVGVDETPHLRLDRSLLWQGGVWGGEEEIGRAHV